MYSYRPPPKNGYECCTKGLKKEGTHYRGREPLPHPMNDPIRQKRLSHLLPYQAETSQQ